MRSIVGNDVVGKGMKYKIVAVGKIKENFYKDAIQEYVKRLSRFAAVEIVEVNECLFNGEPNAKEINRILDVEGKAILSKAEGYVVAMDIDGQEFTSERLSHHISEQKQRSSVFTFIIGGSYGLSSEVKTRADLRLSFGKITLPHQLCRVVVCEQLYRACCIEHNVSYHK